MNSEKRYRNIDYICLNHLGRSKMELRFSYHHKIHHCSCYMVYIRDWKNLVYGLYLFHHLFFVNKVLLENNSLMYFNCCFLLYSGRIE